MPTIDMTVQYVKQPTVQYGGLLAWIVVLTSALFFFYEFLQMNMFNVINNDLMQAFNIGATQVSNLSAGYFYADVLLLFPAGILLDRFSTRWILVAAMSVCVVATFLFAFSENYWFAFAMRLLCGFGAAFNLLSSLRLASRWFASKQLALVTGAVVTMAMLGGMAAQTPMTLLVAAVNWRHAVMIDSGIGLIFLLLIILLVRDYPRNYLKTHLEPHAPQLRQAIWTTIRNSQNWFAGLFTSFLNLPILVLGALWGINYLVQVNGFSRTQASLIDSMIFLGMIVGCPLLGWISDRIRQRKKPMIYGAIFSIIIIFTIRFWPNASFSTMLILFFLMGLFISSQVISYPLITASNPLSLTASALGLASVIIMGGGAIFQPLMGFLLDLHWNGTKIAGVPVYSIADYQFAFWIFPIMFVIGLVCACLVKEHH
ncbi:MAG: MFS transporter [Gammaproteobacteria bacterium]|nr:MFS transporter [Gammaproteobacteria bacterium]